MAFGGHLFTDAAAGGIVAFLVDWLAHGYIYRWPSTRLSDAGIDAALTCFAWPGYRLSKQERAEIEQGVGFNHRITGHGRLHAGTTFQTSCDKVPAPARSTTTIHGGIFQTVRSRKPVSASAKSRGVNTALVQTGT